MASSKRLLYVRAPSQTPPPQTRKSLAQGVLVTEPTMSFGNPTGTPHRSESGSPQPSSLPMSSCQTAELPQDTDHKLTHSALPEQILSSQTSPVLLVDASGRHKSPDLAEVPVITSIVKSPVRVVCHTPRAAMKEKEKQVSESPVVIQRSDDHNTVTGHTDAGRRVQVTGVPHINIVNSSGTGKEPSPHVPSPDSVTNGSSTALSPMGHYNRASVKEQSRETTDQFRSFLGEEGYHPPLSSNLSASEIKQQLFDFSDIHSQLGTSADQSVLPGDKMKDKKMLKKKKQKTRVVPSRYMAKPKAVVKVPSGKEMPPPAKKKGKVFTSVRSDQHSPFDQSTSSLDLDIVTPYMQRSYLQKGLVTSTPADGLAAVNPSDRTCTSAPTPILRQGVAVSGKSGSNGVTGKKAGSSDKQKSLAVSKKMVKTKVGGMSHTGTRVEHTAKPSAATDLPPMPTSTEENETSQKQLELLYSRVLQASFLYSKLKHSFAQKEKDAQAQMYSVWQEKEKLQREVANLELELKIKTKLAELDRQIQLQLAGLKPVGSHMVKLILEYSQLAAALDTTRHHMSVDGVLLPNNHNELLAALDESERLLGEIDALMKQSEQKVSAFAKDLEGLSKTVESETQEHKRCYELLAAASTLSTQERSLQAQVIMDNL